MSLLKQFTSDSVVYGLGKGLKKFIGFFLLPFYTRILTPEDFGILETLSTSIVLITAVLNIGLDSASGFYFFKYKEQGRGGEVLYTTLILRLITVIPMLVIGFFSASISSFLFGTTDYAILVWISCMITPISLLMSEQEHLYRFLRFPWKYNVLTLSKSLLGIAGGIILVLYMKNGPTGAQLATLLSSLLTVILSFVLFSRSYYVSKFDASLAKEMIVFGAPLILVSLLQWIYVSSDRYMLLYFKSEADLGIYSIGATLSQPLQVLNMAVQMSFSPLFYESYNKEKDELKPNSKDLLKTISTYYLIIGLISTLIFGAFGDIIVSVIAGDAFLLSTYVIPYLMLALVLSQLQQLLSVGLYLKGKTMVYTIFSLSAAALNVILNFYFIPKYGIIGAAGTTVASYLLYLILAFVVSKKHFDPSVKSWRMTAFGITITVLVILSQYLYDVNISIIASTVLKIVIGISSFILPFVFGLVTIENKRLKIN